MSQRQMAATLLSPVDELLALVDRVNMAQPKDEDVVALQAMLRHSPAAVTALGDLTYVTQDMLIRNAMATRASQEALRIRCATVKHELGYATAGQMDKQLIDHLLLCWLRLQWAESVVTGLMGETMSMTQADYWERTLSTAQRRYLRAIETLSRVRKMGPALQINIAANGGRQVNQA